MHSAIPTLLELVRLDLQIVAREAETAALPGEREALVAKLEGQTHQVKTNEAYTALLSEIDAAKDEVSDAETAVLEAMEAIETARAGLERVRRAASEGEKRCQERARDCDEREKSAEQTLANLRRERERVVAGVDAALVAHYDKIAAKRRPAVAVVKRGSCGGCKVAVPAQRMIEMKSGEELVTCGSCHRILVPETGS